MVTFDTMSNHFQINPFLLSEVISPITSFLPKAEIPTACLVSKDWYSGSHDKRHVIMKSRDDLVKLSIAWIQHGFRCGKLIIGRHVNGIIMELLQELDGLMELHFEDSCSFNEEVDNLPSTLICLTLPNRFNQSVDKLPRRLTHLTFGLDFNLPIDNLPSSVTHLTFDKNSFFNHPVNNLPSSVTHLTFGMDFNQPVDNLPSSVTYLTFDKKSFFNQSVDNLPSSVTHLTFGMDFKMTINMLPVTVKQVYVHRGTPAVLLINEFCEKSGLNIEITYI
jgi:FNIP Repeat